MTHQNQSLSFTLISIQKRDQILQLSPKITKGTFRNISFQGNMTHIMTHNIIYESFNSETIKSPVKAAAPTQAASQEAMQE